MGTTRTNATGQGQGTTDVTVEEAHAPIKKRIGNATTTTRTDAAGASAGTTQTACGEWRDEVSK